MIKKRIVPEHEEEYTVCDWCGKEITDYSSTSTTDNKKHWHSMHNKNIKETCYQKHRKKLEEEYINKNKNY